jgi:hypothetical protein
MCLSKSLLNRFRDYLNKQISKLTSPRRIAFRSLCLKLKVAPPCLNKSREEGVAGIYLEEIIQTHCHIMPICYTELTKIYTYGLYEYYVSSYY